MDIKIFVCNICNRIFGLEECTSAVDDPEFLPQHPCASCNEDGEEEDGDLDYFRAVILGESW